MCSKLCMVAGLLPVLLLAAIIGSFGFGEYICIMTSVNLAVYRRYLSQLVTKLLHLGLL